MDKNLRWSDLKRILESFGLVIGTGRGSEAKISDPHRTRRIMRIKKHDKNPEIPRQVIGNIRRKFQLRAEDRITDADFYGRA